MKYIKLLVALLVVSSAFSQQRIKIDGVAAVVGENIVLDSDIVKFKQELLTRSEGKAIPTDCEVLDNVMQQKMLAHQAVVDSVVVADSEIQSGVDRTIDHFKQQLGDITKVVELYGFSNVDDLRAELERIEKENLLISRERQSVVSDVKVTPEEVRFFYNDLKEQGKLPNFGVEVELSQIVIKAKASEAEEHAAVAKLKKMKEDIEGGYSMRLKAMLYSQDPGVTQNGGLYTIDRQSPFVKEFKETAFSLEEGEVSDPFRSDFGYHILKVEKIKGQQRDARHILIQPNIPESKLTAAKKKLEGIKAELVAENYSFEEGVKNYSDDKATKQNKGILVNPYSNDTKFELNKMDPKLFAKIDKLEQGDITEPFYEETREGEKMYKIIWVRKKTQAHQADFALDYVKIQNLALQKKQQEVLDDWYNEHIKETYIKISDANKSCGFKYNWLQQ